MRDRSVEREMIGSIGTSSCGPSSSRAIIMVVGAVFVALNTIHTAVMTRLVEIAALRALRFGRLLAAAWS